MKASEWIQSVERVVKEDKDAINKPVKCFGSCLVSLSKDYYLLLLSQNVCYLLLHNQGSFPAAIRVHWSITLSFEATAIRLHPNGKLGALVGERGVACFSYDVSSLKWKVSNHQVVIDVVEIGRSRSHSGLFDIRVDLANVDLCWHPSSSSHLCLLTSDNTLWFWNVFCDVEEEEQRLSIALPDSSDVVSFCFGTGPGWEFFTAYLTSSKGDIYFLCPLYPYGCCVSKQFLKSLQMQVEEHCSVSFQEKYSPQKSKFSTREKHEDQSSCTSTEPALEGMLRRENIILSENARQQRLFIEECLMACELNDNLKESDMDSSIYCSLGRTINRWIPTLQGPIVIQKDSKNNNTFYEGEDYYIYFLEESCSFPTLIHTSSCGYIRVYIQLGQIEPLFTNISKGMDSESRLDENPLHFVLFENIELFGRRKKESCTPVIVFKDFGESIWCRNKWLSHDLKRHGPLFFIGTDSELFLLRIPWLNITLEGLNNGVDFTLSNIRLLATTPNRLESEALANTPCYVRGITFFVEPECLGIIINFSYQMIWIPLVHESRAWDRWTFMASELDAMLKHEDDETIHSQRPLEKRCEELLKAIATPPRYARDKELSTSNVEMEVRLRFLQDAVTKYREEYISNFEKLFLILSDAMDKIPKGLEKVERKLENVQSMLKSSQKQLENLEDRVLTSKKLSKSLLERAKTIREVLIEGRGRLSKAELAWNERLLAQWKDISRYQSRTKELKKSVENACQGLGKETFDKPPCFTKEELNSIYQSLNEHTLVLNRLFSMVTKLEQAFLVK